MSHSFSEAKHALPSTTCRGRSTGSLVNSANTFIFSLSSCHSLSQCVVGLKTCTATLLGSIFLTSLVNQRQEQWLVTLFFLAENGCLSPTSPTSPSPHSPTCLLKRAPCTWARTMSQRSMSVDLQSAYSWVGRERTTFLVYLWRDVFFACPV